MNEVLHVQSLPVAEALIGLSVLCGIVLRTSTIRIDRGRALVAGVMMASLVALFLTTLMSVREGVPTEFEGLIHVARGGSTVPLLGVDALSSSFALLAFAVGIIAVLGAERARLTPEALSQFSFAMAGNLLTLFSNSLWFTSAGLLLVAALLPTLPFRRFPTSRGPVRMARTFLGAGAGAMIIATAVLAVFSGDGWVLISSLNDVAIDADVRWIALALILFAVLSREAIFPFHSWFVPLAAEDPSFAPSVTLLPHVGVFVVLRVVVPTFPLELTSVLPVLSGLAAATALVLALRVLVQQKLQRGVALIVVSQSALILVGIETMNLEGVAGGLMALTAMSLSGAAFLATTSFATSRIGERTLDGFSGLGRSTPRLAAAFFVFGLAMVAFPGTVGFVGEDLLFHGAFEQSVPAAIMIIVAAALNGYMVLSLFSKTFLGPAKPSPWLKDLLPLELVVVVVGFVFVIGLGLFPQPLLSSHTPLADAVSHSPAALSTHRANMGAHPD